MRYTVSRLYGDRHQKPEFQVAPADFIVRFHSIMNETLYVGNLSYSTNGDTLRDYFAGAGQVVSASVISDRETGRSRGFGFVQMANAEEAQKAIEMFDGKDFEGRPLRVNVAKPKTERAPRESRW